MFVNSAAGSSLHFLLVCVPRGISGVGAYDWVTFSSQYGTADLAVVHMPLPTTQPAISQN
jgi:hypothetical protein